MDKRQTSVLKRIFFAAFLTSAMTFSAAHAQSAPAAQPEPAAKPAAPPDSAHTKTVPYRYQTRLPDSAIQYYASIWGVDTLSVKAVESGELIRFSYRVLDVAKAQALNDKKNEPSLICPRAGVKLVIPSLEKVGKLRQSSAPEAGKVYWMAFSNKGRLVKPGDRVSMVIGQFRADGLIVQ